MFAHQVRPQVRPSQGWLGVSHQDGPAYRGVLRRTGHTEAVIDLALLAGFEPGGVLVEIMNEDGTMARLPELMIVAKKFNLKIISPNQLFFNFVFIFILIILYLIKVIQFLLRENKINKKCYNLICKPIDHRIIYRI